MSTFRVVILLLIAGVIVGSIILNLTSGTGAGAEMVMMPEPSSITAEEDCEARGGTMMWVQSFFKSCIMPYPDAGEPCTSSSECEGGCIVTDWESLDSGTGVCKADTNHSGCYAEIGDDRFECLNDDIMTMCLRDSTARECAGL